MRWELTHLRGTCVYPGYAVGRVRSLGQPPGERDILVAPILEPGDIPEIFDCRAAVIEQGGITSHAAIVARELGVPTLTGVIGAASVLSPGEWIFVDTELGRVLRIGLSEDCLFCDPEQTPTVWTGDRLRVIEDMFPVVRSHLLVIPRRHVTDLAELDGRDWSELGTVFTEFRTGLISGAGVDGVDGVNLAMNVGSAAGQTVPHLHWHLLPRRAGDDPNPHGGVRRLLAAPFRPYPDPRQFG